MFREYSNQETNSATKRYNIKLICLPFINLAEKPTFWTEPSETNLTKRWLPVERMSRGILYPQYVPIRGLSCNKPSRTST